MTPPNYVWGVLLEDQGRVLLTRTPPLDNHMSRLWSLPGREVQPGEAFHKALKLEFYQQYALNIEVGSSVYTLDRDAMHATVFIVHDNCKDQLRDGADARFFDLSTLPEHILFETRLALSQYILLRGGVLSPEHYTGEIDSLFSALFYSYLYPSLPQLRDIPTFELLEYIITTTPFRKFN